jgi:hypothetical protein
VGETGALNDPISRQRIHVAVIDPEFSADDLPRSKLVRDRGWLVRILISIQALVAIAAHLRDFVYVAAFRRLIAWDSAWRLMREWESVALFAILASLLFPPLIIGAAGLLGLSNRDFWLATGATLSLMGFEFYAMLPAVQ